MRPVICRGLIRAYNEATGVANTDTSGYHETITLRVAARGCCMAGCAAWYVRYMKRSITLLASEYGRSDWLLGYWSKPVLFSVEVTALVDRARSEAAAVLGDAR